jgi:ribosome-binding protein aMBF1 (putative translation factor)
MTFSEYVRKVRRGLDMSQHELAKELNVNFTTINRWENKRVIPSNLARKSFVDFCKARDIEIPSEILNDGANEK